MTTATKGVPVVLTGQALRSLRDSGYSIAAAFGEVIDNALEANANSILIRMDEREERGKAHVHRVAFVDDGTGMDEHTLQHYPQIGFSTRYMRTDTIGKFGVGAKLAALNFGKRIDIWTRTDPKATWRHVFFDLDEAVEAEKRGEDVEIAPPDDDPVPNDLLDLLPEGTGTLVLWSKVDRLEAGRHAKNFNDLRVEVEKEISRIFRVFLHDGIVIDVNGTTLFPHDPLFLMGGTWADHVLTEQYAQAGQDDVDADAFKAELIERKEIKVAGHSAWVTVTLYPPTVTRERGLGRDQLSRALRVPENEGAISFMRLNREISYTNVPRIFPRGVQDPDRFIGIEVSFAPELDDYFGVRNVKRGAEPHDHLRESIRKVLQNAIPIARTKLDEHWGTAAKAKRTHYGEHGTVTEHAAEANRTMPKGRALSEADPTEALETLATDVLGSEAKPEDREKYIDRVKDLPFVVESIDFPGRQFIDVQHVAGKVIIRINTRHRFYREVWEPMKIVADTDAAVLDPKDAIRASRRAIEALTLLLIAYGKAESMQENPLEQYGELRDYWGMFLDSLLGKVKDVI